MLQIRKKIPFILIAIVVVIGVVYLLYSPENDMTFEFYSDSKLYYDMDDYDDNGYVVENYAVPFYNDPEHKKVEIFYQNVMNDELAVFNQVSYGRGNIRHIDNFYFDGNNILVNRYEVNDTGTLIGSGDSTCSNQIELEVTNVSIKYWLVDCQIAFPPQEAERVILYEQPVD